ncbi:MAG: MFS transporter [Lachnospiraceae bacterium]|nr:MFS transporter [Lachnospiraceae bacterium]
MDTQMGETRDLILRDRRNLICFIISYVINNLVSGVLYDTYVNYLQEVSPSIATSFWSFYGYATFISALILILVPKAGYRKLLVFCSLSCTSALFSVIWFQSEVLYYVTTLLSLVGVQLHYIMLSPYVATYTEHLKEKSINWYTRAYYMGYIGYFVATYLGGAFVVKMFSLRLGVSYSAAQKLTEYVTELDAVSMDAYLKGNCDVLLAVGVISLLSILPVLFIQERKEDYRVVTENQAEKKPLRERVLEYKDVLLNRYALCYLAYWSIVSFAMGLFTSYYTVYLNRNLHIDKATSSLLVSISYIAIVLFMFFTPLAVRKMGQVGTICFSMLLSIPFMITIGLGDRFGAAMVPVVGTALFVRSGLANLSSPVDGALSMAIAPKELRPAFTSMVNFLSGFVSILSGMFTGQILFRTQAGYRYAYFIAAALYAVATAIIFLGLHKKYNRTHEEDV